MRTARRHDAPGLNGSTWRTISVGALATAVCVLPVFLTGALAVQIRADLAFGSLGLGIAVGAFRGAAALSASPLGRWVDRLGARRSIRVAVATAGLASIGVAATATSWSILVSWLVVGGCALALGQAGVNRLLVVEVKPKRIGIAFGVKQTAQPVATMLAGLSVPFLALTVGWQWGFALAAALAIVVLVSLPRRPAGTPPASKTAAPPLRNRPTILLVAIGFGLGNLAVSTVPAFFVDSAVRVGITPHLAGGLLAVASGAALLVRLGSGLLSDRISRGHLRICAGLLAVGSVGIALLALGRPGPMMAGVVISLAGAWAYNVLIWVPLMQAYPSQPGAITGAVMPGGLIGGTVGPIVFGAIAQAAGDPTAWLVAAISGALAAVVMMMVARRLERESTG